MWVASADLIGLPLHIVEGEKIVESFGLRDEGGSGVTSFTANRVIALDAFDRIFAAREYEFLIDVWTTEGRRLAGLEGPKLNQHVVQPGAWTEVNPPANRIWAVRIDDEQRLWVVSWHRKRLWMESMRSGVDRQGQRRLEMKDPAAPVQSLFDCRISVVDLKDMRLVVDYESPQMLLGFVGNTRRAVAQEFTEDGSMRLGIWDLTLSFPRREE